MACVDTCPHSAISSQMAKDGHYYPVIDPNKCVQCGLCTKTCPITSGFDYGQNSEYKPLAAWCKDDEVRLNSSSGGIFAAIATYILQHGGIVVGCKMVGLNAQHVTINNIMDLRALQGSKYLHSNCSGIYTTVKKHLNEGKQVLFSGTRCQVAGLLSYLKKPYENLQTIDLVCTGVPSYNLLKFYKGKYTTIASFRDKQDGWKHGYHLTLVDKESLVHRDSKDGTMLARGFQNGTTNRYSCYNCQFSKLHGKADLTLMDLWGDKDFPKEHFKGISCVIPNSTKGKKLLKEANVECHESEWKKCLPRNPRLVYGKSFGMNYNIIRKIMPYAFEHFSYKTLLALYAGVYSSKNPFHIIIKTYKFLSWKIMMHDKRKFVNKILLNLKTK